MGGYPPGTSASDPNAPWNAPAPIECQECGGVYGDHERIENAPKICHDCGHGGFDCGDWNDEWGVEVCPECGSEDISLPPCPNEGMNRADYEEAERMAEADRKYDAMKEDGEI